MPIDSLWRSSDSLGHRKQHMDLLPGDDSPVASLAVSGGRNPLSDTLHGSFCTA